MFPEYGQREAANQRAASEAAQGKSGIQHEGDLAAQVGREDQGDGPNDGGDFAEAQEEGFAAPGDDVLHEVHRRDGG